MTSPSGGSAVNQVKWIYNAFGLVIRDEQEHSGTVTGSTPNGTNVGVDFDPNGNMVRIPTGDALTGAPRKLVWNAWDQLVEVRDNATNALIQRNIYDALYRRTTRQAGSSALIHTYYNQQWRPVEERLGTSTSPVALYFWGIRHRDDLVRRDRATSGTGPLNESLWCLMDYFDPMAAIDSSGAVQERYSYSAFGVPLILAPDYSVRSSSSVAWDFLFHGQFTDAETGYQNYGFRYYLPPLGRWLSRDPIGEIGGANLYLTSRNNLVNLYDLVGLKPLTCTDPKYQKFLDDAVARAKKTGGETTRRQIAAIEASPYPNTINITSSGGSAVSPRAGGNGIPVASTPEASPRSFDGRGTGTHTTFDQSEAKRTGYSGQAVLEHEIDHIAKHNQGNLEPNEADREKAAIKTANEGQANRGERLRPEDDHPRIEAEKKGNREAKGADQFGEGACPCAK